MSYGINLSASEAREELENCRECIENALRDIKDILKENFPEEYERARSYWVAHIEGALRKETEWLGRSFITMDDTLEAIERDAEPDMEEDEDEEFENLNKTDEDVKNAISDDDKTEEV